jgi:hypothetical protein
MKQISLSLQEYTSVFLELASQANEKFKIVKTTKSIVVVLVTIKFAEHYGV